MKFSEQWLREWVNPAITTDELVAQLTMAGLEVDSVEPVAGAFTHVVVGKIVEAAPHPNAKKLQLCKVDVGADDPLSIVCGAANAREGLYVAVAQVGAQLPIGLEIKPTEIRGEASEGMLCAESELGMADKSDGIMELPESAPIGSDLMSYLKLNDQCIEVDLTPNRGDCLSILGLARETAVLNDLYLEQKPVSAVEPKTERTFPVEIVDQQACPHYAGRVVEGVNTSVATPIWMQECLRRSGIRSLDLVVDITNYVMLELGQPMHAFDLDQLNGSIIVRPAEPKEPLTLLDGQELALRSDSLVIADQRGPLALAGVMGGANSGITAGKTQNLFLESAFFDPIAIAGQARSYGLHTDSSHRFERGVDFQLQVRAIERATQLIVEIAGGNPGPIVQRGEGESASKEALQPIHLRHAKVDDLLGFHLPGPKIEAILTHLGMSLVSETDGWLVTPTSYRFDIREEVDLIEELGRIYGYNNIPTQGTALRSPTVASQTEAEGDPSATAQIRTDKEGQVSLANIKRCLSSRGYQEVITYSFVDPDWEQLLAPQAQPLALANPISADLGVMRTHLWPGLLKTAQYNLNRQQERLRIFESGLRFRLSDSGEVIQEEVISGLVCGRFLEERWSHERRPVDFFDVKSDVMALFSLGRLAPSVQFKKQNHSALHPGQTAEIVVAQPNGHSIQAGWLGALHPSLENKLGFSGKTDKDGGKIFLFELILNAITAGNSPAFTEVSKFPAVRRDLALIINSERSASELVDIIYNHGGEWLKEVSLFDLYVGDNIGQDKKSIAVSVTLQHPSRTLNDEEINTVIDSVVAALQKELDAILRD